MEPGGGIKDKPESIKSYKNTGRDQVGGFVQFGFFNISLYLFNQMITLKICLQELLNIYLEKRKKTHNVKTTNFKKHEFK
jgi:hypothetical protein